MIWSRDASIAKAAAVDGGGTGRLTGDTEKEEKSAGISMAFSH